MLFAQPTALLARLLMFSGFVLLFGSRSSLAQSEDNLEYKIKTAYLYNFTKFIEWPDKHSATFNLCIIGSSPIKAVIPSLEGKTAFDKPISIRYFDTVKQVADCHIAYFEQLDSADSAVLNTQLKNTLTVSSQELFAEHGGMIGFALEQEKLRLHINVQAIKRQGLTISAKLIEVAVQAKGANDE